MGHSGNFYVSADSVRSGTLAMKVWDSGLPKANSEQLTVNSQMNLGIKQEETTTTNGRDYLLSVWVRSKDLVGTPRLRLGIMGGSDQNQWKDFTCVI
jgi:hypothetical protein